MMKKMMFMLITLLLGVVLTACSFSFNVQDDGLESTRIALAVQQTQLALEQEQAAQPQQPQEGQQEEQPPEELPTEEPPPADTEPPEESTQEEQTQETQPPEEEQTTEEATEQTQEALFQEVEAEPEEFFCNPADGPTELTIKVDMTDINRGGALFWRLQEKATDTRLEWELVDMGRHDHDTRIYTFDADIGAGTDNFYYPAGMGESWFEFQIISNDGEERTEVFSDVTFFPCP